jgi:hypothetical protein
LRDVSTGGRYKENNGIYLREFMMIDTKDEKLFHLRTIYALRKEEEASRLLTDAAHADLANIAASIVDRYPNASYITLSQPNSGWEYHPDIWVEDILDGTLNSLPDACEYANDLLENFDSPRIRVFAGIRHNLLELVQWLPVDFINDDDSAEENCMV